MIYQQMTLSGDAEWPKVADAVIEARFFLTKTDGGMCMQFNLEQIDTLLSTTRAVRRRLDLDRGVPDDILLRCIDLAEQAPSGGNIASRRWLIIRDPDIKARLAVLYREAGGNGIIATAERLR